ncbi:hypothetical protein HK102_007028 [Quaeritorhiza haematococci]|nr:hypothetical protein HK102_007028 [Quaeritorhiza haematococci]
MALSTKHYQRQQRLLSKLATVATLLAIVVALLHSPSHRTLAAPPGRLDRFPSSAQVISERLRQVAGDLGPVGEIEPGVEASTSTTSTTSTTSSAAESDNDEYFDAEEGAPEPSPSPSPVPSPMPKQRWYRAVDVVTKINRVIQRPTIDNRVKDFAEKLGSKIAQRLLARAIVVSVEMLTAVGVAALAGSLVSGDKGGVAMFVVSFLVKMSIDRETAEAIAKEVLKVVYEEWGNSLAKVTLSSSVEFASSVWKSFVGTLSGRKQSNAGLPPASTATATATGAPAAATATQATTPTGQSGSASDPDNDYSQYL